MMGKGDRLGTLEMGVPRHRHVRVPGRGVRKRISQIEHAVHQREQRSARPEADIVDDLVIARAAGVQATGDSADDFPKSPFDTCVHILVGDGEREVAGLELGEYLPETALELSSIFGADDALLAKHARVRDGAANILSNEANIERN